MKEVLKKHLSYYIVQQKAAFSNIPKLLLCILCFALLFTCFAFAGSRLLYGGKNRSTKVKIALVVEDENPLINLAAKYVNNLESVNSICTFFSTDKETAYEEFAKGNIYAVVTIPENFVDDMQSGINSPAGIILQKDSGAEVILFETLANAAAYTLKTAQTGIYAFIDIFDVFGFGSSKNRIIDDVNELYIDLALRRAVFFDEDTVSATDSAYAHGGFPLIKFYGACAAVMLIMVSCTGCASFCQNNSHKLSIMIKRYGICGFMQTVLQCLALSVCYFVIFLIPLLFLEIFVINETFITILFKVLPFFFVLIFGICSFALFLFKIAKTPQVGILLLFTATIIMMLFSGGILPSAFLPYAVRTIGKLLPSAHYLNIAFNIVLGSFNIIPVLFTLSFAVLFLALNSLFDRLEK